MNLVTRGGALLAAALLCLTTAGVSHAQLTSEPLQGYFGDIEVAPNSLVASKGTGSSATNAVTTVYDNTLSAANFGFTSTDPLAVFGDEIFTTGLGILSSHKLSLFNAGTSLGPVLNATIGVQFFDAATAVFLGSYNVNVNFGAGLNPGFFSTITVTPLDPLLINLNTTHLLVLQTVVSMTGTASNLGIASRNPPTIGSSPAYMYISASTVGGGVPGYYNIGATPANPINQIGVSPPPVSTVSKSWSQIKKLYR
ncbi:MAG: hypothetical protein ABL977_00875 [Candidatus Eisenbacteria bacterium]